jgi:hypothetical protein
MNSVWTRQEKLGVAAIAVAVVACLLTFVVPEVRQSLGLNLKRPTPSQAGDSEAPEPDVDASAAQIFDRDPSAEPALPKDANTLFADGRSYYVVFRPSAYVIGPNEPLRYITRFTFCDPHNAKRWVVLQMYSDYRNSRTATLEMFDHVYGENYLSQTSLLAGIMRKGYTDTIKTTEFQIAIELLNVTTRPDTTESHAQEFIELLAKVTVSPLVRDQ